MFELFRFSVRKNFWLYRFDIRLGLHHTEHGDQPVLRYHHVGVKQYIHVGLNATQRFVVSLTESVVPAQGYDTYFGKFTIKQTDRLVRRAVVDRKSTRL